MRGPPAALAAGLLRARLRLLWALGRRAPLQVAGAAGALGALYFGLVGFALPRLGSDRLGEAVEAVHQARGSAAHLALAAAAQVAAMFLCAAPLGLQLASQAQESELVRLFGQTVRVPRAVALALSFEAAAWLGAFVDLFLFPVLWSPFVPHLGGRELCWLFAFKLAAGGGVVLLAQLFAAVSLLWGRSRLARAASWVAAAALALAPVAEALQLRAGTPADRLAWPGLILATVEAGALWLPLGVGALLVGCALGPGTRLVSACLEAAVGGEARLVERAAHVRPPPAGAAQALVRLVWLEARLWAGSPWRVLFFAQALVLFVLPAALRAAGASRADAQVALAQGFLVLLSAVPALAVVNGAAVVTEPATLPIRRERGAVFWGALAQVVGQALPVQLGFAAALAAQVWLGAVDGRTAVAMGASLLVDGLFLGLLLQAVLSFAWGLTQSRTALGLLGSAVVALGFGGHVLAVVAVSDPLAEPARALWLAAGIGLGLALGALAALGAVGAVGAAAPRRAPARWRAGT